MSKLGRDQAEWDQLVMPDKLVSQLISKVEDALMSQKTNNRILKQAHRQTAL